MNWKLDLTDQIIFQSFVFQHLIGTLKYPHKNPGGRFKITYLFVSFYKEFYRIDRLREQATYGEQEL